MGCKDMRTFDNGRGFTVCYDHDDANTFAASWPCSTVEGRGAFTFGDNGALIDAEGSAEHNDGPD